MITNHTWHSYSVYMPLTKSFPFFRFHILEKVKVEVKSFRIFWEKQQQVGPA
jgi:hypothetical protein